LHDLAEASGLDVRVRRDAIPVRAEVAYGCEMLGLDPLDLVNEGKALLAVEAVQTEAVLTALRSHPLGQHATIIGELAPIAGPEPKVLLEDGGRVQWLHRREGSAIPRLC
jgi:hydrogenase expression/formation protein HypE